MDEQVKRAMENSSPDYSKPVATNKLAAYLSSAKIDPEVFEALDRFATWWESHKKKNGLGLVDRLNRNRE